MIRSSADIPNHLRVGWKAWYEDAVYKSSEHSWEEMPQHGMQILKVVYEGGTNPTEIPGKKYAFYDTGRAEDPTEYRLDGRDEVKYGTMLSDESYNRVCQRAHGDPVEDC